MRPISSDCLRRAGLSRLPEIVGIVQRYVKKKVSFREGLDPRELGLKIYSDKIVTLIRDNILPAAAEEAS